MASLVRLRRNPEERRWYNCLICATGRPSFGDRSRFDAHLRREHNITEWHEIRHPSPDYQSPGSGEAYYASKQSPLPFIANSWNVPAVCDFCTASPVVASYGARDFTVPGIRALGIPEQVSRGGWAACQACHVLIERDEYDRLAKRAVRQMNYPPRMLAPIRAFHEAFRLSRTGPAMLLGRSQN